LYDDTLQLYENLAKRQGDNPAVRRQRIKALINSGEILRSLRENEKAEKLLLQAAELIEAELKSSPDDLSLNELATGPYWQLGVLYKDISRAEKSLEFFHRDLDVIDSVLRQQPNNLEFQAKKANTITNECVVLRDLGKGVEAIGRYEEAIATLREIRMKASSPFLVSELAMALHDYSTLLRSLGRHEDFQKAFQESFEIRQEAHHRSPNAPHIRAFLSRMYMSQGEYDRDDKQYESSVEQYQRAIDLLQPAVDEYPDLYEYQRNLIDAMIAQMNSCLLLRNEELGKSRWQRFALRLQSAMQKFPKDQYMAQQAANWLYLWGDHLWENNQRTQAIPFLKTAIQASIQLPALATTPLTAQQEAIYANTTAWRLAVAPDPSVRSIPKSIELARRAVELVPNSANSVHTLGTALYLSGDYAAAREQLLKSIQLEQLAANRGTLEQLFDALKALPKEAAAAQKELDESFGLKKSSPDALALHFSMLAMTLWKLGEQETARDILRLVVDPPAGFSRNGPEARRLIKESRELVRPQD
jgi:tetratricopeptide (TPR) repeat protein